MNTEGNQEKTGLVVKSNSLIYASHALNIVEQRLILLSIITARQHSKPINSIDPIEIEIKDYIDMFGTKFGGSMYEYLKESAINLYKKELKIESHDEKSNPKITLTRWVSSVSYIDNEARIELRFSPEIVPEISALEKRFTSYYIEDIRLLTSSYALRLYELIIAWRSTKQTKVYELAEFRSMLGVEPHQYQSSSNFKARVLDPAVSQINERTNLKIEVTAHKRGRTISGYSFRFVELVGKKETIRDPNTIDWVDESPKEEKKKKKREKMTLNQIVAKHPNETMGLKEPQIFDKYGSMYYIVK